MVDWWLRKFNDNTAPSLVAGVEDEVAPQVADMALGEG